MSLAYDAGPNNGPPVVFLHGLGARRQDWRAILPEFAVGYHVFAPDLRGHGDSGRVPGEYRFSQYADDIVPFLRDVVAEPAALVGHSLGGVIATVIGIVIESRLPNMKPGIYDTRITEGWIGIVVTFDDDSRVADAENVLNKAGALEIKHA